MKTTAFFPFLLALCLMTVPASLIANAVPESSATIEAFREATTKANPSKKLASLPLVRFFTTDTIVVVSPEKCKITATDKADIENAVYWDNFQSRPVYVYKTERELTRKDARRHLLFVGCLHQFQRTSLFQIPVTKARKGFRFENRQFDNPQDSFFYINPKADRMYLCKNAPEARHAFFAIGGTPFALHVFRNNRLVMTGYNI
ncbi:MAG: hypothetical protein RBT57_07920 [Paludibacter sp.]|jgi:hypothetical protein|nr:hypothetical protein [Paludibacter sp.]